MAKPDKAENYSDELNFMADMAIKLNMVGDQSKLDTLFYLSRMKENQPKQFKNFQAAISEEQVRKNKRKMEAKERDKKTMADKSGNPSSRDRSKNERAIKFPKKRPMNLSGKSRGGLTKAGSMDYRKKGMFY